MKDGKTKTPLEAFLGGSPKPGKPQLPVSKDGRVLVSDVLKALEPPMVSHMSTPETLIWFCAITQARSKIEGLLP